MVEQAKLDIPLPVTEELLRSELAANLQDRLDALLTSVPGGKIPWSEEGLQLVCQCTRHVCDEMSSSGWLYPSPEDASWGDFSWSLWRKLRLFSTMRGVRRAWLREVTVS